MGYNIFNALGYTNHVSQILSSLCTYEGTLPQGGVTSPILSNIVCIRLDRRLAGYAGKRNISYTRYADDLTFSALRIDELDRTRRFSKKVLEEEGFSLNHDKTRFIGPRRRRKITGITISDTGYGIGKKQKKKIRAAIYNITNKRLTEDEYFKKSNYIKGWLAFIKSVDKNGYTQLKNYYDKLSNT